MKSRELEWLWKLPKWIRNKVISIKNVVKNPSGYGNPLCSQALIDFPSVPGGHSKGWNRNNWGSCSYVTFRDDWKILVGLFSVTMASISRPRWMEKVTLYPSWIWILKSFQWKSKISNMTVTVIFLFLISIFFIYLSVRRRDWLMENNWKNMRWHKGTTSQWFEI